MQCVCVCVQSAASVQDYFLTWESNFVVAEYIYMPNDCSSVMFNLAVQICVVQYFCSEILDEMVGGCSCVLPYTLENFLTIHCLTLLFPIRWVSSVI